jgi:uroporphyrinogen-III decarboxylase
VSGGWTGRRRLLAALAGEVPDRVPVNTYEMAGLDSRDWYNRQPAYRRLMDFIRAHTDPITNWNPEPPSDDYLGDQGFLASSFPVEVHAETERAGSAARTIRTIRTPKGDLRSATQIDPALHTTWNIEHPCKSPADVDRALSVPYEPLRYDAADLPRVRAELGDRGIVLASIADPAYLAADLMGFEDFLVWAFSETEHFARTVDIVAGRVLENLRRSLDCCVVDAYRICGPEYFTPPYMPPAMFRRFVVPHVTRMVEMVHGRGSKARIHCHGRVGKVLDMILETGADALDPCEPPPDGDIGLAELKRRCAARGVSVWGNIELKLLEGGTPDGVRAEVRRVLADAKEGGGFVLMPTASPIGVELPARTEENYRALIETALELGRY